jgi:hypothetical protein
MVAWKLSSLFLLSLHALNAFAEVKVSLLRHCSMHDINRLHSY